MYSIAIVVPAGRNCGRAYRKTPCQLEIPPPDVNQPLRVPSGNVAKLLTSLGEVVRVRLHGVDIHIRVQAERIGHDIAPFARRDVHVLSRQSDEQRVQSRRPVAEVQPEARLHRLFLPAWPQVQHHDEIGLLRQRPGHSLGRRVQGVSGKPAEKKSLGAADGMRNQPFVTGLRVQRVEPARRSGGIELHRRMVDDVVIAGEKLPRLDVSRLVRADRQDEVSIDISAGGRAACRTVFAARDRVRQAPTRRSMSAGRAAGPDRLRPRHRPPRRGGSRSVRRSAAVRRRTPRSQVPASRAASHVARRRDNRGGVTPDVVVGEQGKRRDSPGSMTGGAGVEDDRRNILGKRQGSLLRRCRLQAGSKLHGPEPQAVQSHKVS